MPGLNAKVKAPIGWDRTGLDYKGIEDGAVPNLLKCWTFVAATDSRTGQAWFISDVAFELVARDISGAKRQGSRAFAVAMLQRRMIADVPMIFFMVSPHLVPNLA
jgi:hypothetical protein